MRSLHIAALAVLAVAFALAAILYYLWVYPVAVAAGILFLALMLRSIAAWRAQPQTAP